MEYIEFAFTLGFGVGWVTLGLTLRKYRIIDDEII